MLLGFQSRDKWNLNNYDAIEIKSKGFYASSVTIPYVQNFKKKFQFQKFKTSTLILRSALFLISVSRLQTTRKVPALPGGSPLQTWWPFKPRKEFPSVRKLSPLLSMHHSSLGSVVNNFSTHYWFKEWPQQG